MDLLFTLDENYLPRLETLLTSIRLVHPEENFTVYIIHSGIPREKLQALCRDGEKEGFFIRSVKIDGNPFSGLKTTFSYPPQMYYRLLAAEFLPASLHKVLYLDPDILVINPLYRLWDTDISEYLFAAASHTLLTDLPNNINQVRLGTSNDYYNSGVLLMNLDKCREIIDKQQVFDYAEKHSKELILPDQDVMNALYGNLILPIEDAKWNYDARKYDSYMVRSNGKYTMEWVMSNTSILHFCGRDKPWKKSFRKRFKALYRHYMQLTKLYFPTEI